MTVLEKIKRCVSLVWDFQEFYGEEDIEEFCRNELHTYPQHDEIMEYFKHIEDLEKENAELKTDYEVLSCSVGDFGELQDKLEEEQRKNNGLSDNLTKAKEIIKEFVQVEYDDYTNGDYYNELSKVLEQAEQFLKGEDIILEDAQVGNSPFDADEVFNKEMKAYLEEK